MKETEVGASEVYATYYRHCPLLIAQVFDININENKIILTIAAFLQYIAMLQVYNHMQHEIDKCLYRYALKDDSRGHGVKLNVTFHSCSFWQLLKLLVSL